MKKYIILLIVCSIGLGSCRKITDNVSSIAKVPTMTLIGPGYILTPVGAAYTDAGATLVNDAGSTTLHTPTVSTVDTATAGMYVVKYIVHDANGFNTEADRIIIVANYTPPVGLDPNFDISGVYKRTSNGILVNIVKLANGLYVIDNFAGSSLVYPAYLTTPDTTSIDIPAQVSLDGFPLDCTSESYTPAGPDAPVTLSWRVAAAGFGTGTRIFEKQ